MFRQLKASILNIRVKTKFKKEFLYNALCQSVNSDNFFKISIQTQQQQRGPKVTETITETRTETTETQTETTTETETETESITETITETTETQTETQSLGDMTPKK